MTVYIFPGQGSQYKGMGKELFAQFPEVIKHADEILGYSIQTLCLEDPHRQLSQTQYTQPALYIVNALSYLKQRKETPLAPRYLAGHSLGEYNALLAADVFDFETGLKLVKKRGELMSQATGGGMAAVLGLQENQIQELLREHNLSNTSIANKNTYTQIVLTGPKAEIERAQEICENAGAFMVIPLNVSGAFHSAHMHNAQMQFEQYLKEFNFKAPSIPVIANMNAQPYQAHNIVQTLSHQMTHPVRWRESISYLLNQGSNEFVEIGPGTVLTGLIDRIKNGQ